VDGWADLQENLPALPVLGEARMKTIVSASLLLALMCAGTSAAHPPTALATDARGDVFFAYWGGTWRLSPDGQQSRIHANDYHFLSLDPVGRFAPDVIPDVLLRLTSKGARPALFSFPKFPATFHADGDLYLAPWSIGRIRVERMDPVGRRTVLADAPIDPRIARTPGRHEGGLIAIASGPKGLYVSDGASIWTVDTQGNVSPLALNVAVPGCATDLPAELPKPHMRALAVDAKGDVYAAATGCRATVKIAGSGQLSVVLRAETPWSPTGVAVGPGGVYVYEYDNTLAEYPIEGRPRIRQVGPGGAVKTLVVADPKR
jgi:hypothetical protein